LYTDNRCKLFIYYKTVFSKYLPHVIWSWIGKYSYDQLIDIGLRMGHLNNLDDTHFDHLSTVYKDVIMSRRVNGLIDYDPN